MKTIEQIIRDDIGQGGPQLPSDEYEQRIDSILGQMNCAELLSRISNAVAEIGGASGSAFLSSTKEAPPATVLYTNYRGETSERTITPIRPWFGSTEWHPEPQWLLRAYDHGKGAERDFALKDFGRQEPSAARELALEEIIALCKDYAEDSQPDSEYRLAGNDIIEALQERRALSSPDHAAAGKSVEGDGWPTGEYEVDYEVICNGEWVAGSTDLNDAKHYASVYSHDGEIEIVEARTYRRPLPSAPSEGAE